MPNEFKTMKEIGKLFGVTSHKVGNVLKDLGYRTTDTKPSKPTRRAFEEGMVQQYWLDDSPIYSWAWHVDKTVALLERAGMKRTPETATSALGTDVAACSKKMSFDINI